MAAARRFFPAAAGALAAAVLSCCFCSAAASSSSPASSSSLHCGTMTSLLAGCAAFVRRGGAASSSSSSAATPEELPSPGTPCCEGVAALYAVAADSAENWRSVCGCMAALVRQRSSDAPAIALLPALCGVSSLGFTTRAVSYCTMQ